MLKGISPLISPELLKLLDEMGHGDEIILADANFPAAAIGQRVVRADGIGVVEMLDAVLNLLPLDQYVTAPVALMQTVPGDPTPEIWKGITATVEKHEPGKNIEFIERFAYYERSKKAFAVVQTGETAVYANVLIKKGVVKL